MAFFMEPLFRRFLGTRVEQLPSRPTWMNLVISVGQHFSKAKNINTGRTLEKVTDGEDSNEIDWALSHQHGG
jgi:hypothetical protein